MKLLCILLLIAMTPIVHAQYKRPSHDELIRLIKIKAAKRQVYWRVWCTALYEGDKERYQGVATRGSDLNIYIEDGATAYWSVYGDNLRAADDALYALLLALRRPANSKPLRRDKERPRHCSPPITGDPGDTP